MSIADTQIAELDFQIADNWKLTVENESLGNQNAALRQQLADAIESMGRVEKRCTKLREEAEQLRSYEAGYIAMRAVRDKLISENSELCGQVKRIHSAYIGVIEKYEQSEEAIMDDYSGTTSYDDGMQRIKQECDELRHRFDDTMVALGIEVDS